MLHLVTAHLDEPHVTAENQGNLNAEIFGTDDFVFEVGQNLRAEKITGNKVRVYDGRGMMEGRYFELEDGDYEDVNIDNGTQNQKRIDLIVLRYAKDEETLVETITLEYIKGTPSETPVQPSYNEGSILDGDSPVDFPIYAVYLDGVDITEVKQLFEVYDGLGGALSEITAAWIDEKWGYSLEDGDNLEY